MKISLQLFAKARDLAGHSVLDFTLPEQSTIADLGHHLVSEYPQVSPLLSSLMWAVNNEYVSTSHVLSESDSVACFPPVSGG